MNLASVPIPALLGAAAGAALLAWSTARLVERHAVRLGLVDIPNERSSHRRPTPRGGGLGIALVVLSTLAFLGLTGRLEPRPALGVLAGALLVAAISLADDRRPLSARLRLVVQSAAAAVALVGVSGAVPGTGLLHAAGLVVAFLWIVGLTNVYNFLDGIDGIAGSQAVVAGTALAFGASVAGAAGPAILAAALAGAALGFLGRNWPPARIFLGDVGSATTGFALACLPLLAAADSAAPVVPLLGATVLAVWPFLFDGILTFGRRLLRGEDVMASHRSHLYQRLVIAGASHRAVTLRYAVYAAGGAAIGQVAALRDAPAGWALAAAVPVVLGLRLVADVRRAESRARSAASEGLRGGDRAGSRGMDSA